MTTKSNSEPSTTDVVVEKRDVLRRAFFCYQKGMSGRWNPTIYMDEEPKVKDGYEIRDGAKHVPTTTPVELTDEDKEWFEMHQSFGDLKRKYPNPNDPSI